MKRYIKKTGQISSKGLNIFLTVVVLIMLPLVVFTLISSKTNKLGGIQSFVVLTGSMEPAIKTGSVIYTQPTTSYKPNDVIAFIQNGKTITHRIVDAKITEKSVEYVTKGDANNAKDSEAVLGASVVGEKVFVVPYLGRLIIFLSTVKGFALLIVMPISLFVLFEILNIKKEMEKSIEEKLIEKMKTESNFGFR